MSAANFGRYESIEEIGRGGMGTVYKGLDSTTQREVAITVLPAELAGTPGYAERFRREAIAAGQLSGSHIPPVYEADEIDGHLSLVTPLIAGTTLRDLVERDGTLTPDRAVHIVGQIAAALDAAAEAGLVHRDVRPSNILVTDDDVAYLTYFGVAPDVAANKLPGTALDTWGYMAPERFTVGTADRRGDVYALACVLYESLTASPPFAAGSSMAQQLHGHCNVDPPRAAAINPAVPEALDEAIARGMAKDPGKRFPTAGALAAAAARAIDETASSLAVTDPGAQAQLGESPAVPAVATAAAPKPKKKQLKRKLMLAVLAGLSALSIIVPIAGTFLAQTLRGNKSDPVATPTSTKPVLTIKPLPVRPVVTAFVTTPEQCPPPPPAPVRPDQPMRICDINKTAVYELQPEAMRVQLTNVDSFRNPLTGIELVQMSMTSESAGDFGKFTAGQVGKQVAFVRDGTVVWGPKIAGPIDGQVLQLSGDLTPEQAKQIAKMLRDGT